MWASSGPLDGFSFRRYGKKSESFELSVASGLKAEWCKSLRAGAVQKIDYTLVFLLRGTVNSKLKILQNGSKYHFLGKTTSKAKGQQFILFIIDKVTQCLFKLALIHAHIWRYTTADKADGLIQNIYHKIASVTLHKRILWVPWGSSISETSAATPTLY